MWADFDSKYKNHPFTKLDDSGNDAMEKWLADNKNVYEIRDYDGCEYVIECYGEKFKDGDKPDSIVGFWIPLIKI